MIKKTMNNNTGKQVESNSAIKDLFKARNLLLEGKSIEEVATKTGLTEAAITVLRNSMVENLETLKETETPLIYAMAHARMELCLLSAS